MPRKRNSTMEPIICQKDVRIIVNKIQEYLQNNGIIKGIRLVDDTGNQVVLLVDEEVIEQKVADAWWSGYNSFLGEQANNG